MVYEFRYIHLPQRKNKEQQKKNKKQLKNSGIFGKSKKDQDQIIVELIRYIFNIIF
jgi:hypothetical protein